MPSKNAPFSMNIQYYSKKSRTYQSPPSHTSHARELAMHPRGQGRRHTTHNNRGGTYEKRGRKTAAGSSNTAALIYSLYTPLSTPTLLPLAPYPDQ